MGTVDQILEQKGKDGQFVEQLQAIIEGQKAEILRLTHIIENFPRELDSELHKAQEQLAQANASKSEFMRHIRQMEHDLRTPLSGIWSMANYLSEEESDEVKKQYLLDVAQSAASLLAYCNTILDFSKAEDDLSAVNKKFELEKLISEVIKIHLPAATYKQLQLKTQYDPRIPPVLIGNSYKVHSILGNLLSNAIKFTETGWIEISASLVDTEQQAMIIQFNIEDTGIGMPDDKVKYLLTDFSPALVVDEKKTQKGGLGLKIVRQYMQEIGGKLQVVDKKDKGTQLICLIPFNLAG